MGHRYPCQQLQSDRDRFVDIEALYGFDNLNINSDYCEYCNDMEDGYLEMYLHNTNIVLGLSHTINHG